MKLYLVGGAVRDKLLGLPPGKDLDFAVESDSFNLMGAELRARGTYRRFQSRPEFVCERGSIRRDKLGDFGGFLEGHEGRLPADFTLCRAEKMYHDKRHPSVVTPADIHTDLSRRDFTVNAVAVSEDGGVIDPYQGRLHAACHQLHAVGNADERLEEDPLRILRGVRLSVTKDLYITPLLKSAMIRCARGLPAVSVERVREELNRALIHDWRATMLLLMVDMPQLGWNLHEAFPTLWLKPTVEKR